MACDLGFLVMDLEGAGAGELAVALVDGYRDAGGDPGDPALLAMMACYRALVRAKVDLVRAGQGGHPVAPARARRRGHRDDGPGGCRRRRLDRGTAALPEGVAITAVIRDGHVLLPDRADRLRAADVVIALCEPGREHFLHDLLTREAQSL